MTILKSHLGQYWKNTYEKANNYIYIYIYIYLSNEPQANVFQRYLQNIVNLRASLTIYNTSWISWQSWLRFTTLRESHSTLTTIQNTSCISLQSWLLFTALRESRSNLDCYSNSKVATWSTSARRNSLKFTKVWKLHIRMADTRKETQTEQPRALQTCRNPIVQALFG